MTLAPPKNTGYHHHDSSSPPPYPPPSHQAEFPSSSPPPPSKEQSYAQTPSSDQFRQYSRGNTALLRNQKNNPIPIDIELGKELATVTAEENGRERLKRHRGEVAGRVWIPEIWGQEELLKDWIDCSAFDASLVPSGIMSARAALIEEGTRANSGGLRIENRC